MLPCICPSTKESANVADVPNKRYSDISVHTLYLHSSNKDVVRLQVRSPGVGNSGKGPTYSIRWRIRSCALV